MILMSFQWVSQTWSILPSFLEVCLWSCSWIFIGTRHASRLCLWSPSTLYTVLVTYYTLLLSQLYVFSNLLEAFKPFVVQFEVVNQMSRVTKGAEFCCLLGNRVEQPTILICDKSLYAIFVLYSFRPTCQLHCRLVLCIFHLYCLSNAVYDIRIDICVCVSAETFRPRLWPQFLSNLRQIWNVGQTCDDENYIRWPSSQGQCLLPFILPKLFLG